MSIKEASHIVNEKTFFTENGPVYSDHPLSDDQRPPSDDGEE